MRFPAVFCSLVLSVGLAVAGPVPEASTPSISAAGGVVKVPEFTSFDPHRQLAPAGGPDNGKAAEVIVIGNAGETKGTSKREEYNPLDERGPSATLLLCTGTRCNGSCFGVNLNAIRFNQCYSTSSYNSLYVSSPTGLNYGVYVGRGCRGEIVARNGGKKCKKNRLRHLFFSSTNVVSETGHHLTPDIGARSTVSFF